MTVTQIKATHHRSAYELLIDYENTFRITHYKQNKPTKIKHIYIFYFQFNNYPLKHKGRHCLNVYNIGTKEIISLLLPPFPVLYFLLLRRRSLLTVFTSYWTKMLDFDLILTLKQLVYPYFIFLIRKYATNLRKAAIFS